MAASEALDLFLQGLETQRTDLEQAYVSAMAEALTYREMFLWAMEQFAAEQLRRERAEERLRQLASLKPWHDEEIP